MVISNEQKLTLKKEIVNCLAGQREIRKIVVFGSFNYSSEPHDLDVAVFQDSNEPYLALAMKYRRMTRSISSRIPMDIIPLKAGVRNDSFLSGIEAGEAIYEK
jgi:predicted nucleotidyltransferase